MTMSMKTTPAIFKKLMNIVLSGITGIKDLIYLNDIKAYEKHLYYRYNKLVEVFEQLKIFNLKIQLGIYDFFKCELN